MTNSKTTYRKPDNPSDKRAEDESGGYVYQCTPWQLMEHHLEARWRECNGIARFAYRHGFDVDPFVVNRNYPAFKAWADGEMKTSTLCFLLGIKRTRT